MEGRLQFCSWFFGTIYRDVAEFREYLDAVLFGLDHVHGFVWCIILMDLYSLNMYAALFGFISIVGVAGHIRRFIKRSWGCDVYKEELGIIRI